MKKRVLQLLLIIFILVIIINNINALTQVAKGNEKDIRKSLTDGTSPIQDIEFTPEKSTYEILPDNTKEISNLPSFTTKTGATGKEISLLKILNEALLIATTVRTFTLPDSIELTEVTNLQYNIIQNFIIVDSAEEIKLLKPFEMPLKNLGKTKILLNSKNEVQSIETIFNI